MKNKFFEKIWNWAMDNILVSSCLATLALGLAFGAVCTALEWLLV